MFICCIKRHQYLRKIFAVKCYHLEYNFIRYSVLWNVSETSEVLMYSKPCQWMTSSVMLQLNWTDDTCGVALVLANTLSTSSAWYVVMVALERLTVICFPFKVISDKVLVYFSDQLPANHF